MSKVVLITGCSTGIGRDLARTLSRSGYTVVATARNLETLKDLNVALKLSLDVTQSESIQQVVEQTLRQFGRIDVLVNNAGYAIQGALEEISTEQLHRLFDVNVYGVQRMIQSVVPVMRAQEAGRVINISSIAGKLVTPVNGAYSASKFALEAISDALRLELKSFGIQVVIIEPGAIKTHFDETVQSYSGILTANRASPYHSLYRKSRQFAEQMRHQESGPEVVSRAVQQAIEAAHPKARYVVAMPFSGRLVLHVRDLVWDLVLRQMFTIKESGSAKESLVPPVA